MRDMRWNSWTITRYFFVCGKLDRIGGEHARGKPAGRQKSRGSSWRGSPVRGSRKASPPGLSGAKYLRSKMVAEQWQTSSPGSGFGHS